MTPVLGCSIYSARSVAAHTATELKSLTGPTLTSSITPGQAISLSLGLTEDMGALLKPEQFQSFSGSLNITAGSGNQRSAVFTASQMTLPTLAHVHLNCGDMNDAAFNTNALTKGLDIPVKVGGISPLRPLSRELQLRQGQQTRLDLRDPVVNTNTAEWQMEVRGLAIGQTLNKGTWSNGTYTLTATDLADLQLSVAANSLIGTTSLTLTYLKNGTPFSQANLSLQVLPWLMPSSLW